MHCGLLRLRRLFCRGIVFGPFVRHAMFFDARKTIFGVTDSLCPSICFVFGNGCHCFVWFDLWLLDDPILRHFRMSIILEASSSLHAKVSDFLGINVD